MKVLKVVLFLGLIVIATSPKVKANIADFDEVWQKRAQKATETAQKAYEPNPHHVANDLNKKTHKIQSSRKISMQT
ncbi:hypothetical protein V6N13_072487 [Hibiscus sabdariffa]|uniref:Pectate lyase N-terminal domain-containing protein n=1 Tax=Hibiscus sabdariffa TaxID=183260 RepID=A0ABR2R7F2_9ROSI